MMKTLKPITQMNGNFLDSETGEITAITYLPGYPRQYRFDASRGIFNVKGETPISKKGEELTILPIAYRVFRDDILGMGLKKWVEFFFINEAKQVCSLLLHGYSVENLMRIVDEMFYDGVNLCEVALSIKPVEKQNKETGNKYFIASFGYKPLKDESRLAIEAVANHLSIWREETLTGDADIQYQLNFAPPIKKEEMGNIEGQVAPSEEEQEVES